jgi:hypothetical protein
MICLECSNWQPRRSPVGMAALGYAPCAVKSVSSGHTFSATIQHDCHSFRAADKAVADGRRRFLDQQKAKP